MTHPDPRSAATARRHRTVRAAAILAALGCSSATAPGERVFELEVAEQRVPCIGVGPRECLQVRERGDAPWELFYADIAGFTHELGFRYVVRVARRAVPNPPADGSSLAYRLVDVVSRTASP